MPLSTIIADNSTWVEHLKSDTTPDSHKMFTTESYFASFWKYAAHGVVLLDDKCRIIEANEAFLSLIGSDMAEIATKELKDLLPACEINTDYTIIRAIIDGNEYSLTKEEDICYEFGRSKYIPVKIVATRVPAALGLPFKHMVVHVYDLRNASAGFDYRPNEFKNITWGVLFKQMISEHFTAVLTLLGAMITLLAFTGHLGDTISHIIDKTLNEPSQQKIEKVVDPKKKESCEHQKVLEEMLIKKQNKS